MSYTLALYFTFAHCTFNSSRFFVYVLLLFNRSVCRSAFDGSSPHSLQWKFCVEDFELSTLLCYAQWFQIAKTRRKIISLDVMILWVFPSKFKTVSILNSKFVKNITGELQNGWNDSYKRQSKLWDQILICQTKTG